MIDTTSVLGYAVPLSIAPGERVKFHLSSASLKSVNQRVVRVRCGDPDAAGPGLQTFSPGSEIDGSVAVGHQPIHPGSCGVVPDTAVLSSLRSFAFGCYVFPTAINGRAQTIVSRWNDTVKAGWKVQLGPDGHLALVVSSGDKTASDKTWTLRSDRPLQIRQWVLLTCFVDIQAGRIGLAQRSLFRSGGRDTSADASAEGPSQIKWPASTPLVLAADCSGARVPSAPYTHFFNGKIDRPRLYGVALEAAAMCGIVENLTPFSGDPDLLGAWDFSRDIGTDMVHDVSGYSHSGMLRHQPMRGATGANWDGRSQSWTEVPWQYGAIHFHDDDLDDCEWSPNSELVIPDDWKSGFYALELTTSAADGSKVESYVPFFVRARRGKAGARIAVIASTATYLAYANSQLRLDQIHVEAMFEGIVMLTRDDLYLAEHRELGLSTYDTHTDGSGVCYSSAARPIINMRPRGNTFNYVNDTHLLDWLEQHAIDYDVLTDEDIHREGANALKPYRTVITATHPEYFSREMIDAFDIYQNAGGRHMYLGGNGFYWRTAFHPHKPGRVEIRRGVTGTRTWEGEAGENNLSFTGEPSGLWRSNGRSPQCLVGVGFDAQVFDKSAPYRRLPGSFEPSVQFAFEGIGPDELIGNFGLRQGGAAGLEIDRADAMLGSPPSTIVMATADRIGEGGLPTVEEFRTTHRGLTGDQNANVRADMVFIPTLKGGAVFSTGSIAWCCALSHNGYANNVSLLTMNVLKRFLDPAPFDQGATAPSSSTRDVADKTRAWAETR